MAAAPQAPPYGPKATRLTTPLPWTQPVENQQTRLDTLARGCPVERPRFEADVVGVGVQEEQGTKWMTLEYRNDERAHSLLVPSVLALEVR